MPTIKIIAGAFSCEPPVVGTTYRQVSTSENYLFNWTSKGDLYESYGMTVKMSLWYSADGSLPYVEHNGSVAPNNATNFAVLNLDLGNPDTTDFQLRMEVIDINEIETLCSEIINIPYSTIIIQ